MKNKGFTLIELLAVIIILGVIMLIAIPSVTRYINDSRKESYIDTARQIVKGAIPMVNGGEIDVYDTNTTYYIPASCVPTENNMASPFGEFINAYVIVGYSGDGYVYYWASVDEAHQGIKIKEYNKLTKNDVQSNIEAVDPNIGIDNRTQIRILDAEDCTSFGDSAVANYKTNENGEITENNSSNGGGNVTFTTQTNPNTVTKNDELTITDLGTFKVIEVTESKSILFPKYNLNVGDNKSPSLPEFAQDASLKNGLAAVIFSTADYWTGNVGEGKTYPGNKDSSPYAYVFDSNSQLYNFATRYQTLVRSKGLQSATVKLMTYEQASRLESEDYSYLYQSTFWLGSARWGAIFIAENVSGNSIKAVVYNSAEGRGFRPIIEVNNSDLIN